MCKILNIISLLRINDSPLSFIISSCSESRRCYKCGRRVGKGETVTELGWVDRAREVGRSALVSGERKSDR